MEFLWNCNNGIIDMKTGAFYEGHTDAFRSTFGNMVKPDEYLFKKNPRLIHSIQSYVGSFMNLVLQFHPNNGPNTS